MKTVSQAAGRQVRLALVIIVTAAAFLTTVPGCSSGEGELQHLKIVDLPYIPFATFYIAQEEGYFAEQGLDVELVRFASATQAMPLLAQGEIHVAAGSINAGLINAIAQNLNIRIVAGRDYIDPDQGAMALVARKAIYESGELDTVAEIEGRPVAFSCTACIYDFAIASILKGADLTLDDITVSRMGSADMIAAFDNGAIDAAGVGSSLMGQIDALDCAERLATFGEVVPNFQVAYVMFGPSLLEDHPEIGKKFMVAYLKGVRQYVQGPTERNLEITQKYTGMDRETLLETAWPPMYHDGRIHADDIAAFQDWAFEYGFVDSKVTVNELVDTSFVDYANGVLGPYGE